MAFTAKQEYSPLTSTEGETTQIISAPRLDYESSSKWRDPVYAILFYIMILALVVACIIQYSSQDIGDDIGLIFGCLAILMAIGSIGGAIAMQIIKCIPEIIIKLMLFFQIGLYAVGSVICFALPDNEGTGGGIICAIVAIICIIYTWAVWNRIPFASTLLYISSRICSKYFGVIYVAFITVFMQTGFIILWFLVLYQYCNYNSDPSAAVIILLVLSYYWGIQVFSNISHTTSCGVAATWYFMSEYNAYATWSSLKRSLTTSFGSICFGSLIVAVIQTMRAMARSGGGNANILACFCRCILACIEAWARYFTLYAFAQVAIYGTSFMQSAKSTFFLFEKRGLNAIINDNLSHLAIIAGCFISGIIVAVIGYIIGDAWDNSGDAQDTAIILAIAGFFVGFIMAGVMLRPITSGVITLFVCYAEDPATLQQNHNDEYNRVIQARPDLVISSMQPVVVVPIAQQQPM